MTTKIWSEADMFNDYSVLRLAKDRQEELRTVASSARVCADRLAQRSWSRRMLDIMARLGLGDLSVGRSRNSRSLLGPEVDAGS
jgi:hypothetical protein